MGWPARLHLLTAAGPGRWRAALLLVMGLALTACLAQLLVEQQRTAKARCATPPAAAAGSTPRRGRAHLHYGMNGGLCNQLNSHVNALTLAYAAGFDAPIMPGSIYRVSFNHSKGGGEWHHTPVSTLLDVAAMQAHWARRGLELLEVRGRWRGECGVHTHGGRWAVPGWFRQLWETNPPTLPPPPPPTPCARLARPSNRGLAVPPLALTRLYHRRARSTRALTLLGWFPGCESAWAPSGRNRGLAPA